MTQRRLLVGVSFGLALYLGCVAAAFAAPVTVIWTHPTSGVQDGQNVSIALADIAVTTLEYGSCSGTAFGTKAGQVVVNAPAATVVVDRPPGTHCFRASTTLTSSRGGLTSGFSNVASKGVPPGPIQPNPPSLIDIILAWIKTTWSRWFA